jgi:hypothetical protein
MNPGITDCSCDETWFHEKKLVSPFKHNESWFHGSTSFRGNRPALIDSAENSRRLQPRSPGRRRADVNIRRY